MWPNSRRAVIESDAVWGTAGAQWPATRGARWTFSPQENWKLTRPARSQAPPRSAGTPSPLRLLLLALDRLIFRQLPVQRHPVRHDFSAVRVGDKLRVHLADQLCPLAHEVREPLPGPTTRGRVTVARPLGDIGAPPLLPLRYRPALEVISEP